MHLQRNRANTFSLQYRISKALPTVGGPSSLSRLAAARLQHFSFTPIDTPFGALRVRLQCLTTVFSSSYNMKSPFKSGLQGNILLSQNPAETHS